jgi:hypothetical protein
LSQNRNKKSQIAKKHFIVIVAFDNAVQTLIDVISITNKRLRDEEIQVSNNDDENAIVIISRKFIKLSVIASDSLICRFDLH